MSTLPKVFVFCNSCSRDWHEMAAVSEDGVFLAGHVCSDHAWAAHDMGIYPNGWKRDIYAKYYPEGYEVVWVEDPWSSSPEAVALASAYERHKAMSKDEYEARVARLKADAA